MLSGASPELRVVVDCVRTAIVDDEHDELAVEGPLDWNRVLELARYHGVGQLLQQGLETMASEGAPEYPVPDSVRTELSGAVQTKRLRNLAYTSELQEILNSFDARDIRALPFKGPVLSAAAYDDVTVREYNDLDLLVHPDDIPAAADLLQSRGYEWRDGTPRLDDAALLGGPVTKAIVHEYELSGPEFDVELRWRVGDAERPFSPAFEDLWANRVSVAANGLSLPALAPADRLLVLAYHGTKHRWYLLKWLCDFLAAMETTAADWDQVLARVREHGVERNLLLGAALVRAVFDYDLPTSVADRLSRDGTATELAAAVVESLATGTPSPPSRIEAARFFLRASDSVTTLVPLLLLNSALHPTVSEYEFYPLPGPLHPLYYVIWPLRLLFELPGLWSQQSDGQVDGQT